MLSNEGTQIQRLNQKEFKRFNRTLNKLKLLEILDDCTKIIVKMTFSILIVVFCERNAASAFKALLKPLLQLKRGSSLDSW